MLKDVEKKMRLWIAEIKEPFILSLYDALPVGKRLRAKLALLIAPKNEKVVELATVIELIHTASLLHDDVIDDAMLRRGVKSINATHDSKTAVMLGDILYSKAYFKLSKLDNKIAQIVSTAVMNLSIGELIETSVAKSFKSNIDIYMDLIYKKTASLIEATASCAAILSNKDEQAYALYGKNIGLSFQIIDDILDITSSEELLGKPIFNDYKDGKVTLPYIYLYNQTKDQDKLLSLYKQPLNDSNKSWLLNEMKIHKIIEKSYELVGKLSREALQIIKGDIALEEIVHNMMKRNY